MKPRTVNLLANAAVACSWTFVPTLASDMGATPEGIGLIVALYAGAVLFSSWLFGRLADVVGTRRVLQAGLLVSGAAFLVQILASDVVETPWALGVARFATGLAIGAYPPALIAYAHHQGTKMGKFAAWGALGWAIGVFVAGLMFAYWQMFAVSSLFAFAGFLVALTFKEEAKVTARIPMFPWKVIKRNYRVYLAILLRHTGASMLWMFFPLYLAYLGASQFLVGMIFAINSLTQFAIMPFLDRFRGRHLIASGLFASAAVFATFAIAKNAYMLIPMQILLATSWSLVYVGCLKEVTEKNVETATASGLLQAAVSASSVIGPLAGGFILAALGYRWTIVVGAAIALIAMLFFIVFTWGEGCATDKSAGDVPPEGESAC